MKGKTEGFRKIRSYLSLRSSAGADTARRLRPENREDVVSIASSIKTGLKSH